MSRKKGTLRPGAQQKTSDPLPAGRQTTDDPSEESTFSDYPPSFFTDGKVKSLAGTCNVLIVYPNVSPDTGDKNMSLLSCWLTESLNASAVINCQRYRMPRKGDPGPIDLELPNTP
jgi:hypothetical protein